MTDYDQGRHDQRQADADMLDEAAAYLRRIRARQGIRFAQYEAIKADILAYAARCLREGRQPFAPAPKAPSVPP